MSKYVNKAWLRLSSAKSKRAIYKYRHQVISLSHIDVFNNTEKGVNLFFINNAICKKNIFNCLSFCIKGVSLHFINKFQILIMIDIMVNEK